MTIIPVYYEMGEVTLPLARGVTLSDSSADPQASAVETDGADAVAEAVNAEPDGWMPQQHPGLYRGWHHQQHRPHLGAVNFAQNR